MEQVLSRRSQEPRVAMTSPVRVARTAGVFYLVVAVFGAFAQIVRVRIYAPGDPSTTAENVVANAGLVRLSVMADLVQATFMVFVVMALYRLLRHVNKNVAQAMVILVAVSVAITCLNMVHQLGALLVTTDPAYAAAFGIQGSEALVLLMLDLQHNGYLVAQIFFGLWLFPLGLLALRSGMFPHLLARLLMVASAGYLLDVLLQFLAPELADAVNPVLVTLFSVGEGSMLLYLLIRGVRTIRPAEQVILAA